MVAEPLGAYSVTVLTVIRPWASSQGMKRESLPDQAIGDDVHDYLAVAGASAALPVRLSICCNNLGKSMGLG